MNMDTRWYYSDGENVIGPFRLSTMSKIVGAGLIQGATQVVQEGTDAWFRLDESPLMEFLVANETPFDSLAQEKPITSRAASSVVKFILLLLINVCVAICWLAWEKARTLATLLWQLRLRISRPWRYVADGIFLLCAVGGGLALPSLDNSATDKSNEWYGYGYSVGDFVAGKVNSGELERSEAVSGRELWSLVGTVDQEKERDMSVDERSACEDGYHDGLYGRPTKHAVRATAP